uniref:Uncharacterized protein n=1 Tax=Gadus morhua TaxID=8049 RepID=A0A8C5BKH3_GADMO
MTACSTVYTYVFLFMMSRHNTAVIRSTDTTLITLHSRRCFRASSTQEGTRYLVSVNLRVSYLEAGLDSQWGRLREEEAGLDSQWGRLREEAGLDSQWGRLREEAGLDSQWGRLREEAGLDSQWGRLREEAGLDSQWGRLREEAGLDSQWGPG